MQHQIWHHRGLIDKRLITCLGCLHILRFNIRLHLLSKNHVLTITPLMGPLNANGGNSPAATLPPEERLRRGEEVLLEKFPAPNKAPRIVSTF